MKFVQIVPMKNGKYLIDYRSQLSGSKMVADFDSIDEAKKFVSDNLPHYVECEFPDGSTITGTQKGFGA